MNSSNAIVISQNSFGESDKYVQFFTKRWGMITALAKAARKSRRRYAGGLDLFCHNEIFIRGLPKQSPYLVELTVLNSFTGLRNNLEKLLMAGKIIRWIKKLADTAIPMPRVFSLLGQSLSIIEKESDISRLELLNLVFKLKFLSRLGLKPNLESCIKCNEHHIESLLDIEAGGIICGNCAQKINSIHEKFLLSPNELLFMRHADPLRLTQWDRVSFSSQSTFRLNKLMTDFTSFHTHTRLP